MFIGEFSIAVAGIYAGKTWLMVFCLILYRVMDCLGNKTVLGKNRIMLKWGCEQNFTRGISEFIVIHVYLGRFILPNQFCGIEKVRSGTRI